MIKRIVITGGKHYYNYREAARYINSCIKNIEKGNTIVIASCGCTGAETLAELYAKRKGYQYEKYPTMWEQFGTSGGAVRNKQMLDSCDLIICLWDGLIGETCSIMDYAEIIDKPVNTLRVYNKKQRRAAIIKIKTDN